MMRPTIMREFPPERRKSWSKSAIIGGHEVTFGVGLYEDGRPCELFIDMQKEGSTTRGMTNTLARMVSLSLQHGASIEMVCHALRGIDYPPAGAVLPINPDGPEPCVAECYSVTHWIACELEACYLQESTALVQRGLPQGDPAPALPDKVAGHISEAWRSGA